MSGDEGVGSNEAVRLIGFHGMGTLATFSAILSLEMGRGIGARFPGWLLALHGWAIGILLIVRGGIGLVETVLIASNARDCSVIGCQGEEPGMSQIGMTGLFWEPLFVTWGCVLPLATVASSRRRA